jgi:hypothetical protein
MNKFWPAMAILAALAVIAWTTLSEEKFRYVTLIILAFFAVRIWTTQKRRELEAEKQDQE